MKAVINLKTIVTLSELPCKISHATPYEVNFHLSHEYATSELMNTLSKMKDVSVFFYSDYVSVRVPRNLVDLLAYVD